MIEVTFTLYRTILNCVQTWALYNCFVFLYSKQPAPASTDLTNMTYESCIRRIFLSCYPAKSVSGYCQLSCFFAILLLIPVLIQAQDNNSMVNLRGANAGDDKIAHHWLQCEYFQCGVLEISADVEAEIWIRGQLMGVGSASVPVISDTYKIQLHHPAGRKSVRVFVPPDGLIDYYVELLPDRTRALQMAALVPGGGNIYRKEVRGYVYAGLFLGAVAYGAANYSLYRNSIDSHNRALDRYEVAWDYFETEAAWAEVNSTYQRIIETRNNILIIGGVAAGLYVIQLLDVAITIPRYGYRGAEASVRPTAGLSGRTSRERIHLSTVVEGNGLTLRLSF